MTFDATFDAAKVSARVAGKNLAATLGSLIDEELGKLPVDGAQAAAKAIQERLAKWLPVAVVVPQQQPLPARRPLPRAAAEQETSEEDKEVFRALEIAEEIQDRIGELPPEGEDFGESVSAKASSIAANIEAHKRVTDAQMSALENMLDGLERWFHE